MKKVKALSLFSGGLDSMLAARVVMEQGIEVYALNFITPFFGHKKRGREVEAAEEFYKMYGIKALIIDVSQEYLEVVRNPKYGYGKNFNPCIDCKIFMMKKAKAIMEEQGFDFVLSGEVLGQRPMSQRRDALRIIERDSGLDGYLLRPLSAKHMKPILAELDGRVDRERLLDFSGRQRRPQMDLAEKFGISDYETPAGGCLLTDPIVSTRIAGLLKGGGEVETEDVLLLATGRHFTLPTAMLYVGRNNSDNMKLKGLVRPGDIVLKTKDVPGPLGMVRKGASEDDALIAAAITARYSDAGKNDTAEVGITVTPGPERVVTVKPMSPEQADGMKTVY